MSTKIAYFSDFHKSQLAQISRLSHEASLFQKQCIEVRDAFDKDSGDIQDVLEVTHQAQRIIKIYLADLQNNQAFYTANQKLQLPTWKDYESVPVSEELQQNLADKLYNIKDPSDVAILNVGDKNKYIGGLLLKRLDAEKISYTINIQDPDFLSLLFTYGGEKAAMEVAKYEVSLSAQANKSIVAYPNSQEIVRVKPVPAMNKIYNIGHKPRSERARSGELIFTLTNIPTRSDAERDQLSEQEYLRLFFEMVDQPWDRISDAQKILIEQFNKASHVRFTNKWGTDVQMSLVDEHGESFTFCNSLIAKNVPGSEIFSAPRRDSVEGRIVSKGRFCEDDVHTITDLTLEFKKGYLDNWSAEDGAEHFQRYLDMHPNNRYVGELGIGTNPHLKRHVANTLLVEKIGGSFHLALGDAYTFKDYSGDPVHVNNGNSSANHWDITTMLYGAEGKIFLDGQQIMENGFFTDERLDVLNRGWDAVPESEKPEYWKTHPTPFVPKI